MSHTKVVLRPVALLAGAGLVLSGCIYVPASGYAPRYSYAPPPQVYAQSPSRTVSPSASAQNCREFQGDAIIDGSTQKFYGTACRQPDGRWHIMN